MSQTDFAQSRRDAARMFRLLAGLLVFVCILAFFDSSPISGAGIFIAALLAWIVSRLEMLLAEQHDWRREQLQRLDPPTAQWWVQHDGKVFGPLSRDQLLTALTQATFPKQCQVHCGPPQLWAHPEQFQSLLR